jgi:hypothetical protein
VADQISRRPPSNPPAIHKPIINHIVIDAWLVRGSCIVVPRTAAPRLHFANPQGSEEGALTAPKRLDWI